MTTASRDWTVTLNDSVHALGAAAREYQTAHQSAVIAKTYVDLSRVRLLDGVVLRQMPGYTGESEPHLTALARIGDIYLQAEFSLKEAYEEAARAYAHGANWAVHQVMTGQQPAHVELKADADGHYLCPDYLPALQLDRYVKKTDVDNARRAYEKCFAAGLIAEQIGAQSYVADHEAGEMHDALDTAAGLADAAYAYGIQAEGALHFALNTRSTRE